MSLLKPHAVDTKKLVRKRDTESVRNRSVRNRISLISLPRMAPTVSNKGYTAWCDTSHTYCGIAPIAAPTAKCTLCSKTST